MSSDDTLARQHLESGAAWPRASRKRRVNSRCALTPRPPLSFFSQAHPSHFSCQPQPPPPFDIASAIQLGIAFDPPLTAAQDKPSKVLKSGKRPQPPNSFDVANTTIPFDPPLGGPAPKPASKPVFKRVPKVLGSGRQPQPPPPFEPGGANAEILFDPPVSFAAKPTAAPEGGMAAASTSEPPAESAGDASLGAVPEGEAAAREAAAGDAPAGYRIKRKSMS